MVNGLHLHSTFIQSTVQFLPLIHPFTHQQRLAAMQGINQLVRSNWGLGVLLRDTSTRPGWDRTGNPPTAKRQLLPPEPHLPHVPLCTCLCVHYAFVLRNRIQSIQRRGQEICNILVLTTEWTLVVISSVVIPTHRVTLFFTQFKVIAHWAFSLFREDIKQQPLISVNENTYTLLCKSLRAVGCPRHL